MGSFVIELSFGLIITFEAKHNRFKLIHILRFPSRKKHKVGLFAPKCRCRKCIVTFEC